MSTQAIRYLSLFSGIGGFELGIQRAYSRMGGNGQKDICLPVGQEAIDGDGNDNSQAERLLPIAEQSAQAVCVGFSEIDKYAIKIYEHHFKEHKNYGDATRIIPESIPDFDLLVGGFPCQAFSIAGKRLGFEDTRGTLFFDIARILKVKRPRMFLLENVKGLLSHDNGRTFKTIITTLAELGYGVEWQVLNSKNHGVPQNRERVFIVGHLGTCEKLVFPLQYGNDKTYNEKMYWLSEKLSLHTRELLFCVQKEQRKELSNSEMQNLLESLGEEVQQGESSEIENSAKALRSQPQGNIQKVDALGAFLESVDDTRPVCGMVSQPTEEMLLLWHQRIGVENQAGQIQQSNISIDGRPNGLIEKLRDNKHLPLLLAVQPYQGRLFFSIGDGGDWEFIYSKKVGDRCGTTLSSILEESVDEKYFLSETATKKILSVAFLPIKICKVSFCKVKRRRHGYCEKHSQRFEKYGNPLMFKRNQHSPIIVLED